MIKGKKVSVARRRAAAATPPAAPTAIAAAAPAAPSAGLAAPTAIAPEPVAAPAIVAEPAAPPATLSPAQPRAQPDKAVRRLARPTVEKELLRIMSKAGATAEHPASAEAPARGKP